MALLGIPSASKRDSQLGTMQGDLEAAQEQLAETAWDGPLPEARSSAQQLRRMLLSESAG